MKKLVGPLILGCIALLGVFYAWTHLGRVAARAAVPSPTVVPSPTTAPAAEAQYAEAELANQLVTVTGPMADHMLNQKPTVVETASPVLHDATAMDRVGHTSARTDSPILHKTLEVARAANLPFEIPAHAANPKLRGTYQAFVRQSGTQPSEEAAEVEFLVLNEEQYSDLLSGRFVDPLFSAGNAHEQEVDFTLPPTFDQSAKYYLVFRNSSTSVRRKFVQADFRIDF